MRIRRDELTDVPWVAPADPLETLVADVLCQVLDVDLVGRDDTVVDLGGTSLDIVRVITTLAARLAAPEELSSVVRVAPVHEIASLLRRAEV